MTIYLIETALFYCELANGQIDLTINTVSELWDFHATATTSPSNHNSLQAVTSRLPDSEAIAEATSHVDYHNLIIEGNTVTLSDPKASISLGFIAKGYIADKMKEYLISQNVDSALINLGGNLLAVGSKPDHTPFQFGIQKPFDEQGTPITTVSVSDKSVVSSGIYERFFYALGYSLFAILLSSLSLILSLLSKRDNFSKCGLYLSLISFFFIITEFIVVIIY